MADTSLIRSHSATASGCVHSPFAAAQASEPPDAISITRSFQSAVFRLRWTILAMKLAANGEHEDPQHARLFWPDLMTALEMLTPDADALDAVVDELRRA